MRYDYRYYMGTAEEWAPWLEGCEPWSVVEEMFEHIDASFTNPLVVVTLEFEVGKCQWRRVKP